MATRFSSYRLLIAVAEEASFTRAAQRLGVPQPWVSTRIRRWEEEIGFPLFIRSHHPTRPVTPTERGRELVAQALRVIAEVDTFDRLVGELHTDPEPLRIGADPISGHYEERLLLLEGICARHPDLMIHIQNMDDEVSLQALKDGHIDICFITGPAPSSKIFRSRCIRKFEMALLLPASHALAKLERVPSSRLKGETMLVPTRPTHPLSDVVNAFWTSLGVTIRESIDSHVLATARMAQRLGLITSTLLDDTPTAWGLTEMVQRPLEDISLELEFRVVSLRKSQRPGVEKFWSCVP